MPQTALPAVEASDVVVMFNTSASEMGAYRDKGLESLRGVLATLTDKDRVKLMAVDIDAVPLTKNFVPPRGVEIDAALQALQNRVPLGATDLEAAMKGMLDSFQGDASAAKTVIYIGDGRSSANALGASTLALIDKLADKRISISSFAVGPSQDVATLAALANQTGGVVALDGDKVTGKDMGAQLSRAIHEPVIWATERKLPASLAEVYPTKMPPLRADRDTVLVGKGSANGEFHVAVKGEVAGQPVNMQWTVEPAKPSDDNAFLVQLVDSAAHDGGYSLPTLGSEGLWEARRVINENAQNLAKMGRQAAASGNAQQAKQLVDAAMQLDPNNSNALVLKHAIDNGKVMPVSTDVPTPPQPGDAAPQRNFGEELSSVEQMQRVIQQKVVTDANVQLNHAREHLVSDPAAVEQDMKMLLEQVLQVPELTADQRVDLRSRISAMIQQAAQRREAKEVADVERLQNLAAARERERMLDAINHRDAQVKGLIDRFDALMEQGFLHFDTLTNTYYMDAKIKAADEAARVLSNPYGRQDPIAVSGPLFADMSGNISNYLAVREASQRDFLDSMHLTDIAKIPTPDDPPIIYPNADFWRQMTDRRKKYKSVDLSNTSPVEEKILNALDETTEMEFPETPLKDVMDYIKERHHIEVQFDLAALKNANPPVDPSQTLVTRTLKGITLRSALKLILSDYNLTYVIKDEVLMITTKDEADKVMVTKVYPVGDLVTPLDANTIFGGSMGGVGGVSQGFGGGMGSMGGGMMGGGMMGGGMGGGGFGGGMMGGGMFDIPDVVPATGADALTRFAGTSISAASSEVRMLAAEIFYCARFFQ